MIFLRSAGAREVGPSRSRPRELRPCSGEAIPNSLEKSAQEVGQSSLEIKRFISLIGLYENIAKMANKIFSVSNQLKHVPVWI